jgi:homocitrate synthase NifV
LYVSVNAEDATRSDLYFLMKFARAAQDAGADRLRICDTVGVMDPFRIYDLTRHVVEVTGITVEMHTHDDFGMATANALAGVKAGATYVNTTVNGLGERAGNASLAEVVMALKYIENIDVGVDIGSFRSLAEYVAKAAGRNLAANIPIVGDNIFTHESGIHAAGVIKNPSTYEAFPPEIVGGERQLWVGKHSGTHSIEFKFLQEYGIEMDKSISQEILARARKLAVKRKRVLFDKELMLIYREIKKERE